MKDLIQELDNLKADESILYDSHKLSVIPTEIDIPDLILEKRKRSIGFCLSDHNLPFEIEHTLQSVDWYGYKETYAAMGLSLFSLLFQKKDYIKLKLTHPTSEIPTIYIYFEKNTKESSFLKTESNAVYKSYEYFRSEVEKLPFSQTGFSKRAVLHEDLPSFIYGWDKKKYNASTSDSIKYADQLIISLTVHGLCELGSLFLDLSAQSNDQTEVCLENPSLGCGGVNDYSLEARFWLPNSFGFYSEDINDLVLTQNYPNQEKTY